MPNICIARYEVQNHCTRLIHNFVQSQVFMKFERNTIEYCTARTRKVYGIHLDLEGNFEWSQNTISHRSTFIWTNYYLKRPPYGKYGFVGGDHSNIASLVTQKIIRKLISTWKLSQLTSLYITAHIDESIACVVSPSYSQHSCARSSMYYMHWISLLQPVSTAYTATITNEYMSAHIFIVYFYIYYITLWAYINENLVIWNEWCVAHRPCLINNLNKLCIYFGWMSHNKHTQHKLRV